MMDDKDTAAQLQALYAELEKLESMKESQAFSMKSSKERSDLEHHIRRCKEQIKAVGGEVDATPEERQADVEEIGGG